MKAVLLLAAALALALVWLWTGELLALGAGCLLVLAGVRAFVRYLLDERDAVEARSDARFAEAVRVARGEP